MKASILLVIRTLLMLASFPLGIIAIQVMLNPGKGDGAFAVVPYMLAIIFLFMVAIYFLNQKFLQTKASYPPLLQKLVARVFLRTLIVFTVGIFLLAYNPSF